MTYASFGRRLAAYSLDVVPIVLLTAGVFYLFFGFDATLNAYLADRSLENRIEFLAERNLIRDLSFLIWLLYSVAFEASPLQGTPGKALCGIKVVDLDGNRLTLWGSARRNLAKLLTYLSLGVGFLWVIFSRRRQAWHDSVAKTYVIIR